MVVPLPEGKYTLPARRSFSFAWFAVFRCIGQPDVLVSTQILGIHGAAVKRQRVYVDANSASETLVNSLP